MSLHLLGRELRSSSANSTSSSKLSACLTPKANEWESEPSYGYYSGLSPDVLPRRVMRNGQLVFDHRFDPSGRAIKDGIFLANRYFVCNPFPVHLQCSPFSDFSRT